MLKTKPVRIDDQLATTAPGAMLADILPFDIQSVTTPEGALITRDQFARVPVPAGFDTNLSAINKGDGAEAQPARTPAYLPRLLASHGAMKRLFATSPVWRWFVIGVKLSGLITLTAGTIALGCYAGHFLLLQDDALRSGLDLAPHDKDLTTLRAVLLEVVVVATAVTVWALGAIRRLWRETLAGVPFVQRFIAMAKFTVGLLGTIVMASIGGVLVWGFFTPMLSDWYFAPGFVIGLVLLGGALHSVIAWVRSGRSEASVVRSGNVTNSRIVP
jgi:hypothetical protein